MRKLLAALPLAILVACSPAPSTPPAGTPAESAAPAARTGTDITAPASAFVAQELEASSLEDACKNQGINWVCNVVAITQDGGAVAVEVSRLDGGVKLMGVASGWKNFLTDPASPITGVTSVTARHGADTATSGA